MQGIVDIRENERAYALFQGKNNNIPVLEDQIYQDIPITFHTPKWEHINVEKSRSVNFYLLHLGSVTPL